MKITAAVTATVNIGVGDQWACWADDSVRSAMWRNSMTQEMRESSVIRVFMQGPFTIQDSVRIEAFDGLLEDVMQRVEEVKRIVDEIAEEIQ